MAALDLLGRRWALRVLCELREGPLGFRELRELCDGMSSSVLRDRLAELTAAGLVAKDNQVQGFELAGDDGKFMPAQAKIEGETVIVSAEGVASPKTVRYGWQNDPKCTLYNAADLPAAPFEASR